MKDKLKFNKKKHEYSVGKLKLQSVTTFVHSFFEPFNAKEVAKRVKFVKARSGEKVTIRSILARWKQSADEGSLVHAEIDKVLKVQGIAENKNAVQALLWLSLHVANNCLRSVKGSEVQVYDEELGLAGTIDLIIADGNAVELVDWKTSTRIAKENKYQKCKHPLFEGMDDCNYLHYCLQLSTYAYILERQGYDVGDLFIIHLKDGVTEYKVPYLREKVIEMLRWKGGK